ncbi:MAG: phosphatidate cytidylyltransferase [Acidobacteriaceae bacterium]|nr:phosphatidate cytidylyltransferase [Acidobacteriaceae bacterium]
MNRVATAIGLIALALYLVFLAPNLVFAAAALTMSLLCYREYAALVVAHRIPSPSWIGAIGGIYILFGPQLAPQHGDPLAILALFSVIVFVAALRNSDLTGMLPKVSCTVLGALYTFAPWRFSIDLRKESVHLLFFALALNWAGDSLAFYTGRRFGKHRLAPVISPKKSWEGAIASVAGSVLFAVFYLGHFIPYLSWWKVVGLAAAGNVAGQFGDLAESAIKRGAGVKDSSNLLPGHGGMLDRVDSNLFTLPVVAVLYWSIVK